MTFALRSLSLSRSFILIHPTFALARPHFTHFQLPHFSRLHPATRPPPCELPHFPFRCLPSPSSQPRLPPTPSLGPTASSRPTMVKRSRARVARCTPWIHGATSIVDSLPMSCEWIASATCVSSEQQLPSPLSTGIELISQHSQLKSITVSPDPPVPGKNLTVTVDADVLEVIEVSSLLPGHRALRLTSQP